MQKTTAAAGFAAVWLCAAMWAAASSLLPITGEQQIASATAIFRGTVVRSQAYLDAGNNHIHTRTVFRVDEVFKGQVPGWLTLVHRGGSLDGRGEVDGLAPRFEAGEERLVFVSRRRDGRLCAARGPAGAVKPQTAAGQALIGMLRAQTATGPLAGGDVSDQAAAPEAPVTGMVPSSLTPAAAPSSLATNLGIVTDGLPARFVAPDRGEPIPYVVDADYLPAGMSQGQALGAVQAALGAWTKVTSLRFVFAGLQSFGRVPAEVDGADEVLRVQLHDHYNYLAAHGEETVGNGGFAWTYKTVFKAWTTGGNVRGNDFHRITGGYVVVQHNSAFMRDLVNFTEVLCHELGHALGLDHSSEDPAESNPVFKQALMYYLAHGSGRGATLSNFDIDAVRQVHPPLHPPPYCYERVMDIVTTPFRPLNAPGANAVELRGYSLHPASLQVAIGGARDLSGTFALTNGTLGYVPGEFYEAPRLDPATDRFYDLVYARCSDGVNASPLARIRVISFNPDSYGEGIPDGWRTAYFGQPNPNFGVNHQAPDDLDGDGFSNLVEYQLGSDPTEHGSNLRLTAFSRTNLQWQAQAYEVYEVYGSSNLVTWTRALNPVVPTNSIGAADITTGSAAQFYRIQKVP